MKKIHIFDHEDIQFFKKKVGVLVGLPDEPDVSSTDNELLSIHKDWF